MLILASASPRRRDLLAEAGIAFEVVASQVEEFSGDDWNPRDLCLVNAGHKAADVATTHPDRVVVGADTIVSLDGRIYGKPRDLAEARSMLEHLCGRTHEVFTGVCLSLPAENKLCRFVEATRVKFRAVDMVDLEAYLASIHPLDKAGAYAAQEDDGRLIECIEGSMTNVIGLPMERLLAALREHFPQVFTPPR